MVRVDEGGTEEKEGSSGEVPSPLSTSFHEFSKSSSRLLGTLLRSVHGCGPELRMGGLWSQGAVIVQVAKRHTFVYGQ